MDKKYIIEYPNLMKEWDWEENNKFGLIPNKITYGSNKKVWWGCNKGHFWKAIVKNRTIKKSGCPYCSGNRPSIENNLSLFEKINEYDYEKNFPNKPKEYTLGSRKKIWWKCEKNHSWQDTPTHRTSMNTNCPYCSGRRPSPENNLSLHLISKEFDLQKNFPKIPEDFTLSSEKKVWWKCSKCKHSWKAQIKNRTRNDTNCPICAANKTIIFSKGEKEVFKFCKTLCYTIEENKRGIFKNHLLEIDIWFPKLNFGIEYNGDYWHNREDNKKRDRKKLAEAREKNIDILVIWESEWKTNPDKIKNKIVEILNEKKCNS